MKTIKPIIIIYALVLLVSFSAVSQERVLTPEDIVNIRNVHSAAISPDGKTVAFVVNRHRTPEDGPGAVFNDIWIIRTDKPEPVRFTWSARSDWSPQWSSDGKWLGFLSNRDGATQVYIIPADGGEAIKLTDSPTGVRSFAWSPDNSTIAFVSQDQFPEELRSEHRAGRDWKVVDQDHRHIRLHAVDIKTKETRVVTKNDISVWNYNWSPDGKKIAIVGSELPTIDASYYGDLYIVEAVGGDARLFAQVPGKTGPVRWSLDGNHIAVKNARANGREPIDGGIYVISAAGGDWRSVVEDFPGTVTSFNWLSNNEIYFTAQQDTRVTLNVVDNRNLRVRNIIDHGVVFGSISLAKDGRAFATTGNMSAHPNELYLGNLRNRQLNRVTVINEHIKNIELGEVSQVEWYGPDNLLIQGVLIKPVGFEEGKQYPSVLQIHGGPEAAYLQSWHGTWSLWSQLLAGSGYAVLLPNYRGSTSRGVDFIMMNMGDMMGKEWDDIVAGAEYLIEEGIADPDRIGIGGWSYGGYTSAWAAATRSDLFNAAIMGAGIANWISFGGMTDIPNEMAIAHWDGYTWDQMDLQWERSPLNHIDENSAPTIILFGERDDRVPPGQGWELYRALQHYGVETEFVLYPRAGHGISEREHQIDLLNRVVDWFERYVK